MTSEEKIIETCQKLGISLDELGVMVVDHGSRRAASNAALLEVVKLFEETTPYRLVEPAHMELAEPSIEQAYTSLVGRGAKFVAVHPYFLSPGRHWAEDIPALAAEAAKSHPGVGHIVTSPLGIHALMAQVMHHRIAHCLDHHAGRGPSCDICDEVGRCSLEGTAN